MSKTKTKAKRASPRRGDLAQRVLGYLRRQGKLRAGERVAVACSGGADSTALLLLLEELRERLGIRLAVLHFNHHLRGKDSEGDERFVRRLAEAHGLECCVDGADVAAEARKARANLEDTARRLRYGFFARIVAEGRATRVAVAHTADDQAETVLAHILRGTGPAGLGGIHPVSGDPAGTVIRPLLEIRRSELREFLRVRKQAWREDQSNLDLGRTRARVRQVLVPLLETEFHPAAVGHLARLADLAREDERFWKALVEERYRALVERKEGSAQIRVADLLQPWKKEVGEMEDQEALAKRLVRRIMLEIKQQGGQLTAAHVQQVLRLALAGTSGQGLDLPGGVRVEREFDRLVFCAAGAGKAAAARTGIGEYAYEIELDARGGARIEVVELGRAIRLKVIDWPPDGGDTKKRSGVLDRDLLRAPLVLRNWRPGDGYRSEGRAAAKKLKRLLLKKRIGLRERVGWPVLTSDGKVVWARGMPPAAEYAARKGTRNAVEIAEEGL